MNQTFYFTVTYLLSECYLLCYLTVIWFVTCYVIHNETLSLSDMLSYLLSDTLPVTLSYLLFITLPLVLPVMLSEKLPLCYKAIVYK